MHPNPRPNPRFRGTVARAAACVGLLAGLASAQSDPLVSKTISSVIADADGFWAFGRERLEFSRIDPFKEPLDIRNGKLPFNAGIRGGLGRSSSAMVFYDYALSDSITVGGLANLQRDGKVFQDTLSFVRQDKKNNLTLGVELSALCVWRDTVVVGGGNAGFAVAKAGPESDRPLAGDSLFFRALTDGEDTAAASLRCALNKTCDVSSLTGLAETIGAPDSVAALAVDSSAADSVWLLIGTHTGLRRGLLSGNSFPPVSLPKSSPSAPIRIERIHVDADRNILWVFSASEYFFSGDHGLTFRKAPRVAGITSAPDSLTGFDPVPEAANIGDTSFINFNLDNPGLVVFRKDSVTANRGTGDFADILLDAGDGFPIQRGQSRLTNLASVDKGGLSVLAVGSTQAGLFLRRSGGSGANAWINVNSLKAVKGGLEEVITYPTLFTGTAPDGTPEYVNLGYRLKKDGKVTITVFNYAMEKVKTLVKGAPRKAGGSRSEVISEDRWDGKDASGRNVSVGVYYILVQSDKGEKGWGKAIAVRGRDQ